jgi:hypothetical protein
MSILFAGKNEEPERGPPGHFPSDIFIGLSRPGYRKEC